MLCNKEEESREHFLLICEILEDVRKLHLNDVISAVPYVYVNHPATGWTNQQLCQLILDPTHKSIVDMFGLPLPADVLQAIEDSSRLLSHRLDVKRVNVMGYRP